MQLNYLSHPFTSVYYSLVFDKFLDKVFVFDVIIYVSHKKGNCLCISRASFKSSATTDIQDNVKQQHGQLPPSKGIHCRPDGQSGQQVCIYQRNTKVLLRKKHVRNKIREYQLTEQ